MFELFAQMPRNQGPFGPNTNNPSGPPPEAVLGILAVVFGFVCIGLIIGLTIQFFFCRTLNGCLKECSPRNRRMEPGQVFLNMIPLFGLIWIFITVNRMEESLQDEFDDRRLPRRDSYGKDKGLPYAICSALSLIPYLGVLIGLVALVFFIMYWIKMSEIRAELARDNHGSDDDDDREPPRRRDDDY